MGYLDFLKWLYYFRKARRHSYPMDNHAFILKQLALSQSS